MEVADEGSNARGVVGIESNRTGFPFGWYQWVVSGEGKPPKVCASLFVPPSEEDSVILDEDCDERFYQT